MTSLVDKFKNDEVLLRAGIAKRVRPPLPLSPPPDLKDDDALYTSMSTLKFAEGRTSRLEANRSSCPPNPLKYERRSPTTSAADLSLQGRDPFAFLPWPVMSSIVGNFELRDRLKAAQVCRRWRHLLTDGRFPLSEVCGVNLFEQEVWELKLKNNIQTAGKVECLRLSEFNLLDTIFTHCTTPGVIKVWYSNLSFLDMVLKKISECRVIVHSLDIYPYSFDVGASLVHQYLPDLRSICMRPHSSEHFFSGLDLEHFPKFEKLGHLNIDSFNFVNGATFPQNIRNLDWQSRNEGALEGFIQQLTSLNNLQSLTVGNSTFTSLQFVNFIQSIGYWNMPRLQYLHLKLLKFNLNSSLNPDFSLEILRSLRILRIELCYGLVPMITDLFLGFTGPNLRVLSISLLTDEKEFPLKSLFAMGTTLAKRDLSVQLSIMQPRDPTAKDQKEVEQKEPVANDAACNSIFAHLLTKFEAAFVSDDHILRTTFAAPLYANLTEIKFIQCAGVDDLLLVKIAIDCPQLSRLSVLSCPKCTKAGMRKFVEQFHSRRSESLKIVWHRDRATSFMTDFFLSLTNEYSWLCEGLNVRCYRKQFRSRFGETVIVWGVKKMLRIQDYDSFEQSRVLGIVLPSIHNQQEDEEEENDVYIESF